MNYLKIVFYGLLAMIERRPVFTIGLLALIILPPIYIEWVRWFYLAIVIFIIIAVVSLRRKMQQMRSQFDEQYRNMMGDNMGFGGTTNSSAGTGFAGFNFAQGMRLEDFVKQMQEQADAHQATTQQSSSKTTTTTTTKRSGEQGEYVDFEEIE